MDSNFNMGFNEQDYQLFKTSISNLIKSNKQKEVLRYLTNVLPNSTGIVTLDDAQDTVKSVKAQLANRNLITYPYDISGTTQKNGLTITVNEDGSITINGTATDDTYIRIHGEKSQITVSPGEYTLSGCASGGGDETYKLYSEGTFSLYSQPNSSTINNSKYGSIKLLIVVYKNIVCDNIIFKPQLELGSTATTYTSYISDFSTVNVKRYGTVETDRPQTYIPTATGEVTGITVLSPVTNITNDKGLLFTKVIGDDFNYISY